MRRRLLDYDPLSGIQTWHAYDDATDTTYIEELQDVEPFLEANKKLQNETEYSAEGKRREWWHVASIPAGVQLKWLKEGINIHNKNHWPAVRRKLMDPEFRYLRTALGNL